VTRSISARRAGVDTNLKISVPRAVSGRCVVPEDRLRRRLGKTAWALLGRLWARRDHATGLTFVSDFGLAEELAGRRLRQVPGRIKAGLTKLRALGLLYSPKLGRGTYGNVHGLLGQDGAEGLGFQTRWIGAWPRRVFVRKVLGSPMADDPSIVAVPKETALHLVAKPPRKKGSGGARLGSGAPMGNQNARKRVAGNQSKAIQKAGPKPPLDSTKKRAPYLALVSTPVSSSSLRSEERGAARLADFASLRSEPGSGHDEAPACSAAASSGTTTAELTPEARAALRAALATAMAGYRFRPQPLVLPARMRDWPVRSAVRPLPPKLPVPASGLGLDVDVLTAELLAANDRTAIVARTYAAACRAMTGQPYWPFVRGNLASSKHHDILRAAAHVFAREGVRPVRWVLWSIDQWNAVGSGMPPPSFVFSKKRLEEKLGWFQSEQTGYADARNMMGPLELKLGERWLAMQRAVKLRAPGEDPLAIAEQWFPGDSWDRDVTAAQAEATRMQADLDRRCAAGEWLWT
jgi:hypothetical protein